MPYLRVNEVSGSDVCSRVHCLDEHLVHSASLVELLAVFSQERRVLRTLRCSLVLVVVPAYTGVRSETVLLLVRSKSCSSQSQRGLSP